ncbi:MAG: ATP-binding cassette domain-containing protein [Frankia sp.]|nr:ATP-binding cassette domain-containing protein [Frankia sp.]
MGFRVDVAGLTVRYRGGGNAPALADVSFTLEAGQVCGLFGREGAGKSTLLATLAAYRRPSAGTVRVAGEDPYENPRLMSQTCLVDRAGGLAVDESTTIREVFELIELLRPGWDKAYADALVELFELPLRAKVRELARSRRAALAVTIGLASRARLTMFDEPHLDLDLTDQLAFYRELRAETRDRQRTVILVGGIGAAATAALADASGSQRGGPADEAASPDDLLDQIVVLRRGRLVAAAPAANLRRVGTELTGLADAVTAFLASAFGDAPTVLADRRLGRLRSVVVVGSLPADRAAEATAAGIDVGPVPTRDFVSYLIDDRQRAGEAREHSS